ncbi:MAG: DUF4292 domain-containing protein [Muribaculaceae bacterium]|nr:DUF4292 domain-containing protein [Muribaculaceae bacterium]
MKSAIRKILPCLIVAAFALGFTACKSSRQSSAQAYGPEAASKPAGRTLSDEFTAMTAAYSPWTTLSVPVKVAVTKPKKVSVSGTLSMVYGKAMSLSLKMLFIEVATLYADCDSVIVVSKPMNTYYVESLERFTAAAGFSLADIQSLLLGQTFAPGRGVAQASAASVFTLDEVDGSGTPELRLWSMTPRRRIAGVDWNFTAISAVDPASEASPQLFALDVAAGANVLRCSFAQSELSPAGVIASMMQLEGTVKKHQLDAVISASMQKARWNAPLTLSRPRIPAGATRMTTEQVLKLLGRI